MNEMNKESKTVYELAEEHKQQFEHLSKLLCDFMQAMNVNVLEFKAEYTSEGTILVNWEGKI
jgi:hypothetical protein